VQTNEPPSLSNQVIEKTSPKSWGFAIPAPEIENLGSVVEPSEVPPHLISHITFDRRVRTTSQTVEGAAVYIIRLPLPSPTAPSQSLYAQSIAEMKAHLGVLRASRGSRLILIIRVLPETGSVDPQVAAMSHLRDLSLFQLANEHEFEMLELMNMLNSVRDNEGCLVLVSRLHSSDNGIVAFEVRYQPCADLLNSSLLTNYQISDAQITGIL